MPECRFIVPGELQHSRLDLILVRMRGEYSRAFWQKLIQSGRVTVDGVVIDSPKRVPAAGAVVLADIPEITAPEVVASDFSFPILYEDEQVLVIDKPAGVVVHPGAGNSDGTVVNALLGRYPDFAEIFADLPLRAGIVHRLDKDTSGCLLIAKTPVALTRLSAAFAGRLTAKTYVAIAAGVPPKSSGEIENLIGRHPVNRQKMAVVERNGKMARTSYHLLSSADCDGRKLSLLEVEIFTGRTHQIRVHLAGIGIPVLGDELYGGRKSQFPGVTRQLLHARCLSFPHPEDGRMLTVTAPLPEDFRSLLWLTEPVKLVSGGFLP